MFSLQRFREQRLWKKRIGAWGFWASAAFAVLDATTPLPTVERGAFVFLSLTLMAVFAGVYWLGSRLPLEETIEIARLHENQLRVTDLTRELNVSLSTAQRILSQLVRKGQAISTTSPDEYAITVYVFPELKADKPIPLTATEWEAYRRAQENRPAETDTPPPAEPQPPPRPGLMDKQ